MGGLRQLLVFMLALMALGACAEVALEPVPVAGRVPLAVLGDSDSHAFQDRLSFPSGGKARGGVYRAQSLQWTEVLAALRTDEIDLGAWGVWGRRGVWARAAGWFGGNPRVPRKQDFAFNFAWSGARCRDLDSGLARQLPPLLGVMARAPETWQGGVVVLRIGINDLGVQEALDGFAQAGDSPSNRALVDACLGHIAATVDALAVAHPRTVIVLVGILDNVDWPPNAGRWASEAERRNIAMLLDRFDDGLRAIAAAGSRRAFIDDRAFFRQRVGARDRDGRPAYRDLMIDAGLGDPIRIAYDQGDAPKHLFLADGHLGTAFNAVWAQAFVDTLRHEQQAFITPISDAELAAFLKPLLEMPSRLPRRVHGKLQ